MRAWFISDSRGGVGMAVREREGGAPRGWPRRELVLRVEQACVAWARAPEWAYGVGKRRGEDAQRGPRGVKQVGRAGKQG